MADKSTYMRDGVLNILKNTSFTGIATVYAALFTSDPLLTGTQGEISGGSYARQSITWGAISTAGGGRQIANTAAVTYTSMPGFTITHVGLFDASTNGNFLYGDALTASQVVNTGGTFEFPIGDLTVTEL